MVEHTIIEYKTTRTATADNLAEPVERVVYFAEDPKEIKLGHWQSVLNAISQSPDFVQHVIGWEDYRVKSKPPQNYQWIGCNKEEKLQVISELANILSVGCFSIHNYFNKKLNIETYAYTQNTTPLDFSGLKDYLASGWQVEQSLQNIFTMLHWAFWHLLISPMNEAKYIKGKKMPTGKFAIPISEDGETKRHFFINKSTISEELIKLALDETSDYHAVYGNFTWHEASYALHNHDMICQQGVTDKYAKAIISALVTLAIEYQPNPDGSFTIKEKYTTDEKGLKQQEDFRQLFTYNLPLDVAFEVGFFLNCSLMQQQLPL